jgi:hypothetical protein
MENYPQVLLTPPMTRKNVVEALKALDAAAYTILAGLLNNQQIHFVMSAQFPAFDPTARGGFLARAANPGLCDGLKSDHADNGCCASWPQHTESLLGRELRTEHLEGVLDSAIGQFLHLKALEYPGVVSVQIIYNVFRQRPDDLFLGQACKRQVAVIARVPLASGLLAGKFKADSKFDARDHRQFNRHGEAFDVGETFAGVPYETGLAAVEEIRPLVPQGAPMAQFALRWILMNEAISVVIPGAKNADQARANIGAAALAPVARDDGAHSIGLRNAYQALGASTLVKV